MRPKDPYTAFRFLVEIDGNQVAGFSDVAGLEAHTETDEYREGGTNDYVHKIAKETKFSPLTLKRGLTDATGLWDWYKDVVAGDIRRKTVSLVLLDSQRQEKWRWIFSDAFPVKWSGSDMTATGNSMAVETLELAHHGMRKQ
jgi:phage tail-like protein